ncbi:MAG: PLAT/LH2 domain-containing protein [Atribacterota bacterium]
MFLDNPDRNDFERGRTDEFLLSPQEVPDLGVITRVYLRHDNSGIRPGWFVVSVSGESLYRSGVRFHFQSLVSSR